jgi:hypothetical protein
MRFRDIPQLTEWGSYAVDIGWGYLEDYLARLDRDYGFDRDPDFQRGHVWSRDQQIAFVEFTLKGGRSGRNILTNCPGWHHGKTGPMVLVDGKQRLTAALAFLHDEIPAFGHLYSQYEGQLDLINHSFRWHVNDLKTREQVLTWYLELNGGGTPHTDKELLRVRALLESERKK